MEFVTLGRTGLRASVAGLGCGGPSRLGQRTGNSEAESIAVVRTALELGINFIDTAEAYGTEAIVGKAIAGVDRDKVILSTKKGAQRDGEPVPAADFVAGVEACLRRLDTDYVDIFHIHGLQPAAVEHARQEIVPAMLTLRDQGKIRFLGVTESFERDTTHAALQQVLDDNVFDVMMVGFNMLNQSARTTLLPTTRARDIGVLDMFAVRRAFSRPARLRDILAELAELGQVEAGVAAAADPLDFLVADGVAESPMDAAYRYCRHEEGVHVVLTGTGNVDHLRANVASILRPPLPDATVARVNALFGRVDATSGS